MHYLVCEYSKWGRNIIIRNNKIKGKCNFVVIIVKKCIRLRVSKERTLGKKNVVVDFRRTI